MAGTNRSTRVDVTGKNSPENLVPDVSKYNFYQLVELLNQLAVAWEKTGQTDRPDREAISFKSSASLAFPTRDVVSVKRTEQGRFQMEVSFLGLHGSQSPMPGYYLDSLAWEEAQGENRLTDFLNIFNHRSVVMLYQIWRKYRYYICFDKNGMDDFSQRMFALVGLGSDVNRAHLNINHSKMLAYAGLLASPGRSPEVIRSLISHCFDLPDVTVHGWEIRKIAIGPSQQNRLGGKLKLKGRKKKIEQSIMGENFFLGSWVRSCNSKFMICINDLSREHFLSFLPDGKNFLPLVMFICFVLRDQLAWDLRLGLAENQAGGMVLGTKQNNNLGWTSFLGEPEKKPFITISVSG
ncbi:MULTISPECIES: type VI secretion system baseplate subunit TssG [Photorhabdus]|uniref:Type VI secretion protein n=4 Tax=Photorhabdus TaxID=29487 RepID=A0A0F7LM23_9GAMM|nr:MULTISPECIES: type VI secretion system baseplate subunit TssG [Photorhabdus]AKH63630.1 type VI secretion protein [Photorhabdus thracensis]ERT14972.1 type VI secretion protein [Photorhabdus temperata J3]KER05121.1 type VI secretion protein, VC_A0111 family [Photorhabdus temperata subsp. temperata Meg1]MCC8419404.1 type VI secretion system baseplate subunit TssG [Photorhabdus thracensis]NHB97787.1 type VI secretion system baseplate subunit TssG [Photorhabdus stackebrandtii]